MDASLLKRPDGDDLAFIHSEAADGATRLPGILFCPGFQADMNGSKALHLDAWARARGQAYTRFDYTGHGQSHGRFEDGTIGRWKNDALAVLDSITAGPVIVIGSSMGGWIGLLTALARPGRVCGFLGIAAAPDFTDMVKNRMTDAHHAVLEKDGVLRAPSMCGNPLVFTKNLLEEGSRHRLLGGAIDLDVPLCLVQGSRDKDVPPDMPARIRSKLTRPDLCHIEYVDDAEHNLSRPQDLDVLTAQLDRLSERVAVSAPLVLDLSLGLGAA